jgi:hypothetical protein
LLKNNIEKRKEIAMAGRKLFVDDLSMEETSKDLDNFLNELQKIR